jgi:aspartate/methionine/tyrosine aminotransferase
VADETYRPLFHSISPSDDDFPPSTINLGYKQVIVFGSVSKAYSLPGIRAGWFASRDKDIIRACSQQRHYSSMTISKLDEAVAAEAVSDRCIHPLLARNIKLCQTNLELMQAFIEEHAWACSWVKPLAGTTAMLKFHKMGKPVDDEKFSTQLLEQAGVLVCPANRCYSGGQELRGYIRVAFGTATDQLKLALEAWTAFMEESFETVPAVANSESA